MNSPHRRLAGRAVLWSLAVGSALLPMGHSVAQTTMPDAMGPDSIAAPVDARKQMHTKEEAEATKRRVKKLAVENEVLKAKLKQMEQEQTPPKKAKKATSAPTEHLPTFSGVPNLPGVELVDGWSEARVKALQSQTAQALGRKVVEKECDLCPEMVVIPAGRFTMGSPESEAGRNEDEGPRHLVTISRPLLVGKHEVTFAEWDACVVDGACAHKPRDEWGRGRQPVMRVSWKDVVEQYLPWLNGKAKLLGKPKEQQYRLLSEAEWEYAARSGTVGPFGFDGPITDQKANYNANKQYAGSPNEGNRGKTVEVGSLPANPWGLHEVHGNVHEWVEDLWHKDYRRAPTDGSAWVDGLADTVVDGEGVITEGRGLRGGAWASNQHALRSTYRLAINPYVRNLGIGFRVARTLP